MTSLATTTLDYFSSRNEFRRDGSSFAAKRIYDQGWRRSHRRWEMPCESPPTLTPPPPLPSTEEAPRHSRAEDHEHRRQSLAAVSCEDHLKAELAQASAKRDRRKRGRSPSGWMAKRALTRRPRGFMRDTTIASGKQRVHDIASGVVLTPAATLAKSSNSTSSAAPP